MLRRRSESGISGSGLKIARAPIWPPPGGAALGTPVAALWVAGGGVAAVGGPVRATWGPDVSTWGAGVGSAAGPASGTESVGVGARGTSWVGLAGSARRG